MFIEVYLETEKIDELLKEEPLTKQSSISDIVNILPNLYEHALKQTKLFIDLEQMNLPLILENGYHSTVTDEHQEILNKLEQSDTLIFIYPLYWFNVTPIMKSFIDLAFWPEYAFSFKKKLYFRKGLWKGKKAIIVYTQGGPEVFHRMQKRMGYHVLKYPLNLSGIYTISTYHIDNLNRSRNKNKTMDKVIDDITLKVIRKIEN
ncbi:NAD(P)H-dependent oxidoreductase [Mammaliicoccus lentus]|uniref:NAD(P)H-dependent oxidoreductase n=1 Tax=Mammaliicoccus lentus TaxID=42858 RepID=UPI0026495A90|nr:NAD(P)H-dependent oxidoreductase [Mammaliicoccus lentus]